MSVLSILKAATVTSSDHDYHKSCAQFKYQNKQNRQSGQSTKSGDRKVRKSQQVCQTASHGSGKLVKEGGRPSSYFSDDDIAYLFKQPDGIENHKIPQFDGNISSETPSFTSEINCTCCDSMADSGTSDCDSDFDLEHAPQSLFVFRSVTIYKFHS